MKNIKNLFGSIIPFLITSCMSSSYFQVYRAASSGDMTAKDNFLVFEDENCTVSYDLWDDGGNMGFQFYNKSDKDIYLNLDESFFILNGIANNYFKNRIFTSSASTGSTATTGATTSKSVTGFNYLNLIQTNRISSINTVGIMSSSGFSVSYNEEKIICIPSKTSKIISEYKISDEIFRDCDLLRYPSPRQVRSIQFSKEQSPLVFSNRIAYTIGKNGTLIKFENEFFVKEVSNLPESEMFENKYDEYCGQSSLYMQTYFKNVAADKFYIRYSKRQNEAWLH
jgi:hypothetical protein